MNEIISEFLLFVKNNLRRQRGTHTHTHPTHPLHFIMRKLTTVFYALIQTAPIRMEHKKNEKVCINYTLKQSCYVVSVSLRRFILWSTCRVGPNTLDNVVVAKMEILFNEKVYSNAVNTMQMVCKRYFLLVIKKKGFFFSIRLLLCFLIRTSTPTQSKT